MYDLKAPFDFHAVLNDPTSEASVALLKDNGIQRHTQRTACGAEYSIYKYARARLTEERYATHGIFRSVVVRGNRILSMSPPKSLTWSQSAEEMGADRRADAVLEEFVEGVMVNVFYDPLGEAGTEAGDKSHEESKPVPHGEEGKAAAEGLPKAAAEGLPNGRFVFSTKSSIHGRSSFFDNGTYPVKSFGDLFREVCDGVGLDLGPSSPLNRAYSYSFVMQHPEYRIVTPVKEVALVLVAVYRVDSEKLCICNVHAHEPDPLLVEGTGAACACIEGTTVRRPRRFTLPNDAEALVNARELTYERVYRMVCDDSANKDYTSLMQGICVSYYNNDGVYSRTKVRDTRHQQIKMLRGNDPKLEFHYFNLRRDCKVKEYLEYYPEHRALFRLYKDKLEAFTCKLHQYYRETYILANHNGKGRTAPTTQTAPLETEAAAATATTTNDGASDPSGSKGEKKTRFANVPYQYRTMLYDLHTLYITTLRPNHERIRFEHVKAHVNQLHAAQLMFSLNYELRAKE